MFVHAKRQEVEKEVQTMLEADVIESAMSDYNSPIELGKKKDGSNRFCVDFRRINLVTKFDTEPMGNPWTTSYPSLKMIIFHQN